MYCQVIEVSFSWSRVGVINGDSLESILTDLAIPELSLAGHELNLHRLPQAGELRAGILAVLVGEQVDHAGEQFMLRIGLHVTNVLVRQVPTSVQPRV